MPALSSIVFCISSRSVGDPLAAAGLAQELALAAGAARPRLRQYRVRRAPAARDAYSAAARPARAPKTSSSGSEFEPEPVRAVDADAGDLAGRVQARQRRRAVDVGVDAAHHVVDDRPHRDQLGDRIDVLVLQAQLAHERELAC